MILILHGSTAIPSSIILIAMDEYLKTPLSFLARWQHVKTTGPVICYFGLSDLKNYDLDSKIVGVPDFGKLVVVGFDFLKIDL